MIHHDNNMNVPLPGPTGACEAAILRKSTAAKDYALMALSDEDGDTAGVWRDKTPARQIGAWLLEFANS